MRFALPAAFSLLFACAVASPAAASAAEPAPPVWQGVWEGTVGTLPIRACFQQNSADYSVGSYYYLSHKTAIALGRDSAGHWTEGDGAHETGKWTLAPASRAAMTGTWEHAGKRLAISLRRVPLPAGADTACDSDAYSQPRVSAAKVTRRARVTDRFAWTELTYDVGPGFPDVAISSFAYPQTRPGDGAIVAALGLKPSERGENAKADYLSCMQGALGSLGTDGDFSVAYTPRLATGAYLEAEVNGGGFCGGAHPDTYQYWQVWDRQDGKAVRIADWLNASAVTRGDTPGGDGNWAQLKPALLKLAVRQMTFDDAECRQAVEGEDFWHLGLDRGGLLLSPQLAHAVQACGDEVVIPFDKIAPFLSEQGRKGMARLKAGA